MEPRNSQISHEQNRISDLLKSVRLFQTTKEPRNSPIYQEQQDRISDLPKSILHHIFTFLDLKQTIQTSVWSKRWRYFWATLPFLNFNCNLIDSHRDGKARDLQDIVTGVLLLHETSSKLQSFRLDFYDLAKYDYIDSILLRSWIFMLVRYKVIQELYLNFSGVEEGFRLPHCLFNSKSLVRFEFRLASDSPSPLKLDNLFEPMSLPCLKTLILQRVQFERTDIPNKFFSACPVLESLTLSHCEFLQRNCDITAPNLKHLAIENLYYRGEVDNNKGYSIKLCAPNLISFRCEDFMSNDYSIENLSALVKADIDMKPEQYSYENGVPMVDIEKIKSCSGQQQRMVKFLRALHNVEDLTLSNLFLEVVDCAVLANTLNQFCNLRCLKLVSLLSKNSANAIVHLLKISPNIESLLLEIKEEPRALEWYQYWDEVKLIDPAKVESSWKLEATSQDMLYHLKVVEIRGVQGRINELLFLGFLLKHAAVLEKMKLFTSKEDLPRLIEFTEELMSLPRASSSISILFF